MMWPTPVQAVDDESWAQTGNCETEVNQADGPNDDVAASDADVDTAEN